MGAGKFDQAIDFYERSFDIFYELEHPNLALIQNNLGLILLKEGSYHRAIEYFRAAILGSASHLERTTLKFQPLFPIWDSAYTKQGNSTTPLNF